MPSRPRAHADTYIAPNAAALGLEPLEGVGDAVLTGSGGQAVMAVVGDTLVDLQWISLSTDTTDVPIALIERVLASLADAP